MNPLTFSIALLSAATYAAGQEIYVTTTGYTARPQCTNTAVGTPHYQYQPFQFSLSETVRYATSVPKPTTTTTYGPPYSAAAKNLNPQPSTTTYGSWLPHQTVITATDTADKYGQAAWSSLWLQADIQNYTTVGLYTTTVNPTPIPTSELVLPPRDYFGPTDCYNFPDDFVFGVAGSAAQIEGAIALEGRGPTLLENMFPTAEKDYTTNENYFLYKQDIARLAAMGVKYYSFSIPWTRILPFAVPGSPVNEAGIKHYEDLIETVLAHGMEPIVTLLHFDTPWTFVADADIFAHPDIGYDNGGYWHEKFVESFVNYGKIVLSHFGDRVPIWITINEPLLYAFNFTGINNVINAHAELYHFYKDTLHGQGKMSLKFNDNFGVPLDPHNATDVLAANRFNEMQLGVFANPLFLGKQYPESILNTLPGAKPFTKEQLQYIGGTADFFGVDPYTATVVYAPAGGIDACAKDYSVNNTLFPYCVVQETVNKYGWDIGYRSESYVYITPTYLREYLSYLWNTFKKPVVVAEFGFPVYDEATRDLVDQLFDSPRSVYYLSYMSEILKSIWEDGVHILGAIAWSAFDNWEFGSYDSQFGIQKVNRTTMERYYKKSFFDLVDFMGARRGLGY